MTLRNANPYHILKEKNRCLSIDGNKINFNALFLSLGMLFLYCTHYCKC